MSLELPKVQRADAVASLRRYAEENFAEPLGELAAGLLLDYVLEEIGPAIYNQAVGEAQARMAMRVADMSGELYRDEFPYWGRRAAKRGSRG